MNVITLAGNITKDAEVRFLSNGDAVAGFGVADNQGKDKSAIFWNCSLFGKRAESLAQYLTKGQPVTVSGTISEREWVDKDGQKRKSMDVRVADVALQGGKPVSGTKPVEGYQGGTGQKDARGQRDKASFPEPADFDTDVPF